MELDKMDENDWKYHGEGNKSLVVSHVQKLTTNHNARLNPLANRSERRALSLMTVTLSSVCMRGVRRRLASFST
ncbi:inositol-pentakisphosphate 2-kinase [Tachysurus ichikawai]